MSKEFIESKRNSKYLTEAVRQEKQLSYFTESDIQPDILSQEYFAQWAERKYETTDHFLNYVKNVFRTENFLTFFKYLRFPLPSAKIINNRVLPDLKRVFQADDANFDYVVGNVNPQDFLPDLEIEEFNRMIFNGLIHQHNSILLTDLDRDEVNTPHRELIPIKNVISIETEGDEIEQLVIKACWEDPITGVEEDGYYYINETDYIFYSKDYVERSRFTHNLGHCPAHFIAARAFGKKPVVRESIFSYVREELEEYNFLKTLQKMTEPNGAIPVATHLKLPPPKTDDFKSSDAELPGGEAMSSQRAAVQSTVNSSQGILQTGTVIKVPLIRDDQGRIDMTIVSEFIKFHYLPVEALEYIKLRISEIERSIITSLVGDVTESREMAKNQMQIRKSVLILENTLRQISDDLSRIRKLADTDFLSLKYGPDWVDEVTTFYGSDFFLETEEELFTNFTTAPNPIERKNILIRISESKYRNNPSKLSRQVILYNILPFLSDLEFDKAIAKGVDPVTFELQNRFDYWIQMFESEYGDIVVFFTTLGDITDAEKYRILNNLLIQLINDNSSVESVRADGKDPGAPPRQDGKDPEPEL
jgi:hypothetical protein